VRDAAAACSRATCSIRPVDDVAAYFVDGRRPRLVRFGNELGTNGDFIQRLKEREVDTLVRPTRSYRSASSADRSGAFDNLVAVSSTWTRDRLVVLMNLLNSRCG
jgi:hypothetical protein